LNKRDQYHAQPKVPFLATRWLLTLLLGEFVREGDGGNSIFSAGDTVTCASLPDKMLLANCFQRV